MVIPIILWLILYRLLHYNQIVNDSMSAAHLNGTFDLKYSQSTYNVIHCHNPRYITSIEQELSHIFYLADQEKEIHRCKYCKEKYTGHSWKKL